MSGSEKKWNHAGLVEIALKWLRRQPSANGHGCNFAVAECASGYTGEIPDAIGFRLEHPQVISVVVEVKVSRGDFLADRKKPHRISGGMGAYRYFMCPEGMIKPEELPQGWGLLWVNSRGHIKPKAGPVVHANKSYDDWSAALHSWRQAADCMREQWLLVKLLSQIGDPEEANRKRKEVYRELDAVRVAHNRVLTERDELAKDNRRLRRDLRLAGPAMPRATAPCE